MKYVRQEFQANVEVYLFVCERTHLSRDLSTPVRDPVLQQSNHLNNFIMKNLFVKPPNLSNLVYIF